MAKVIDKIAVEVSVEDVQPAILKALKVNKSKLIEWRELMAVNGYTSRAKEIQGYIDIIREAE